MIRSIGGPEAIERDEIDEAALVPGAGKVRVRQTAVGLNFIDTYRRSGLYSVALPSGLGTEAAGTIEAVGEGAGSFAVGDRVAYATGPIGAYATVRLVEAEHLIALPNEIDDQLGAAVLLKGMTAAYLVEQCARIQAGQAVLVHAAAGGMGSILVPWLKSLGAQVIGHTGSPDKASRAIAAGADHALSCDVDALPERVRELTNGKGVDVVLDGVGRATWTASLASLAQMGLMVTYGNASGAVPAFTALDLMDAGSIFITRPTLSHYGATAAQRQMLASRLFAKIAAGLQVPISQRFPLADAAQAHRALEARQTTGTSVLIV